MRGTRRAARMDGRHGGPRQADHYGRTRHEPSTEQMEQMEQVEQVEQVEQMERIAQPGRSRPRQTG
ncbi:hypothetical protein ACIQ9E_05185 [Streptomyces sp. NPDC094448]|uniref:hypothetical protein n=1 Tax=Streptomyces sp. NPDC094448 TaxID=3366063 RepID=UPI00380FB7F1